MEDLKKLIMEKTGLSQTEADNLENKMAENPADTSQALAGGAGQVSQLIQKFGFSESIATKVAQVLTENAGSVTKFLASGSGGLLDKAKGALGGLFGGKSE